MWASLAMLTCAGVAAATTVDVDLRAPVLQPFYGAGVALSESSAALLLSLPESEQRAVIHRTFVEGNFRALRLPMGGCDFSLSRYSYDELPPGVASDLAMSHFSIARDEQYVLPALRKIVAAVRDAGKPPLWIVGSPWSAPSWMKTTRNLNGGALDYATFAAADLHRAYAQYFAKFVASYQQHGINVTALTLQNEPRFSTDQYPSMLLSPAEEAQLAVATSDALAAIGASTKIILYDHNWDDPAWPIEALGNLSALCNSSSGTVERTVIGSAFHCYAGNVAAQSVVKAAAPHKQIFFTECSGGAWSPNFSSDLLWDTTTLVIGGIANWASTVLKWNWLLTASGGPKLPGGCGNCRGVVTAAANGSAPFRLNEDFYALAHVAQFADGDSVHRLGSAAADCSALAVAGLHSCGSHSQCKAVVVAAYSGAVPLPFQLRLTDVGGRTLCANITLPATSVGSFVVGTEPVSGDSVSGAITTGDRSQLLKPIAPVTLESCL